MDFSTVHDLNRFLVRHDGLEDAICRYEAWSIGLFLLVILGLFVASGRHVHGICRRSSVAAGASAALALAIGKVISTIVARPRPFVSHPGGVHLFAAHAADSGFPSDHATASFAIATAILLRHRTWGAGLLVMAAILAAGRVAIGVHYPTDVLAGAALGAITARILWGPRARSALNGVSDLAGTIIARIVAWAGGHRARSARPIDGPHPR